MKADRQRKERILSLYRPSEKRHCRWLVNFVLASLWLYPVDVWGAIWPAPQYLETDSWALRFTTENLVEQVPPFRVASRNRLNFRVEGESRIGDRVRFYGSAGYLSDKSQVGERVSGLGDVQLGVTALVLEAAGFRGDFGWQVKLPNAADDAELGTDETDVTIVAMIGRSLGELRLMLIGGMIIMGDPLRFSGQDDAAVVGLDGWMPVGPVFLRTRTGGTIGTARNPPRMTTEVGLGYGCRWRAGIDGLIGLTAAEPDYGGRLWVGLGPSCD